MFGALPANQFADVCQFPSGVPAPVHVAPAAPVAGPAVSCKSTELLPVLLTRVPEKPAGRVPSERLYVPLALPYRIKGN